MTENRGRAAGQSYLSSTSKTGEHMDTETNRHTYEHTPAH